MTLSCTPSFRSTMDQLLFVVVPRSPNVVASSISSKTAIDQTDEIRYACGHHAHKGHSAPLALHDAWPSANIGRPEEEGHTMRRSAAMATAIGDPRINYCYSRRIDYVLVGTPGLDGAGHVESCEVVGDDRFGGIWPSDHMGVLAQLRAPSAPNHKL